MKPVNILVRVNAAHHRKLLQMAWQRQLDKNAINPRISVQRLYERDQIGLRGTLGQLMLKARHANLKRLLRLVANIDRTCWVFTDKNDRKPRHPPAFGTKTGNPVGDARAQISRMGFSVNDRCGQAINRSLAS